MALIRTHFRLSLRAAKFVADPLAKMIHANLGAYCVGALAPDAHGNRAVPREQTHFYVFRDRATWGLSTRQFLQRFPNLAKLQDLDPIQAAYTAGYLTHLAIDEVFTASLGRFAEDRVGHAIQALTWAIETDWRACPGELLVAEKALKDPPDISEPVVRPEHLHHMLAHGRSAAEVRTPGEYHAALSRYSGREISAQAGTSAVTRILADASGLVVPNVADVFARRALVELRVRLRAYAGGKAASYDAPVLRSLAYPCLISQGVAGESKCTTS